MTDIAAALGLAGIRRFAADSRRREEIWRRYDEAFAGLPLELPPAPPPGTVHARQLYSPLVDVESLGRDRDWVRAQLLDLRVGTGVHYLPVHHHPYYRERLGIGPGDLPNADRIAERTFTLPLSAHLTDEDVEYVISAVRHVCTA
jgi:dTDP-4-amino-4,6-dideoxygalactose transaminase